MFIAAIGLIAVALILFLVGPPDAWIAIVYGLLFISGSAPNDNGPSSPMITWELEYSFQTTILLMLLIGAFAWVMSAPAAQVRKVE